METYIKIVEIYRLTIHYVGEEIIMATIYSDISRTFSEYLLLPNLTTKDCMPENVDLATPITKFAKGEKPSIQLNIPIVSLL